MKRVVAALAAILIAFGVCAVWAPTRAWADFTPGENELPIIPLNPEPQVKPGWVESGNKLYYRYADGSYATGAFKVDGEYYYANTSGEVYRNRWFGSGATWYVADETGKVLRDTWVLYQGYCFYVGSDYRVDFSQGAVVCSKGSWYHLKADGTWAVGFDEICGNWYYFDKNGRMVFNTWIRYAGSHYFYFGADGVLSYYFKV